MRYHGAVWLLFAVVVAWSAQTTTAEEPHNPIGLEWLLQLYNPHRWGVSPPGELTIPCRNDIKSYLMALGNGSTWAAQMTDASGRYSSQFFFGNDFWLGSLSLCYELVGPYAKEPRVPFRVHFHVAKLAVHLGGHLTPTTRRITLGLCLPEQCDTRDIGSLLKYSNSALDFGIYEVLNVRKVPGEYKFFEDIKVHVLGGVAAVMLILMIAGTCYEMLLERRARAAVAPTLGQGPMAVIATATAITVKSAEAANHKQTIGLASQMLLSFSVHSNGKKILCVDVPEDSLSCVHGLRFLSLAWVILVHTYLQVFAIAENKTLRTVTERNILFQTISNATFSVDTFFFISGLLVTFLFFRGPPEPNSSDSENIASKKNRVKEAESGGGALLHAIYKFFLLLFYRFIRLTPAYLFVLGMAEVAMRYIQNVSVFEPTSIDHFTCANYWWRNALYINSLFPRREMCMLWSWYMANDTQFYVIGVMLLILATRYPRIAGAFGLLLMISSWVTTAVVAYQNQYKARIQEPFALFDELYDKPWMRLGPYLVGMAVGFFLFKTKCRIQIPCGWVFVGWTLALGCLLCLVYGLVGEGPGLHASAAYAALGHTAWGLSLAWIVVACCTGHGGPINGLLSFPGFFPLSRLTFCAYLVHPIIMWFTSFQMDGPLHLYNNLVVILYLGNVVTSFLLSFVVSLAFEAPIVRLLKILLSTGKKKSK